MQLDERLPYFGFRLVRRGEWYLADREQARGLSTSREEANYDYSSSLAAHLQQRRKRAVAPSGGAAFRRFSTPAPA